jgi:hypothetical protein
MGPWLGDTQRTSSTATATPNPNPNPNPSSSPSPRPSDDGRNCTSQDGRPRAGLGKCGLQNCKTSACKLLDAAQTAKRSGNNAQCVHRKSHRFIAVCEKQHVGRISKGHMDPWVQSSPSRDWRESSALRVPHLSAYIAIHPPCAPRALLRRE